MRWGLGSMEFPFIRTSRGVLLGTTALVALGSPTFAADIIVPPNLPNVTLTAGDNLIVNPGGSVGLSPAAVSVTGVIAGSISNSGGIFGTTTGVAISSSGGLSGGISNAGTIDGAAGGIVVISTSTVTGSVTNDGTISGGVGIISLLGSDIVGGIVNNDEIISGLGIVARSLGSISGGIENTGNISSSAQAISLSSGGFVGSGIVNSGILAGTSAGINASSSSTVSGGIDNSGTIFGALSAIGATASSLITGGITNTGLIGGPGAAIVARAGSTISGGIDNQNLVVASSFGIAALSASSISGGVVNSGTVSAGGIAVLIAGSSSLTGGIDNGGVIGASGPAIVVTASSKMTGGIQNTGTISASGPAILIIGASQFDNGVTNSGLIASSSVGIVIDTSSTMTGGISNAGTISASGPGIIIDDFSSVSGNLQNSGVISSEFSVGIVIDDSSTLSGALENSGTISAAGPGIIVASSSLITNGLTNSGLIVSQSSDGLLVDDTASIIGGLSNSGTISGFDDGIEIDGTAVITGGITNSGLIFGSVTGLDIDDASTVSGGINNSGTISGSVGIKLQPSSVIEGGITNSGRIVGTSGLAIAFGDDDDSLILQTGSDISGATDGAGGDDLLVLQGSGVENDDFLDFEQLDMNGDDWALGGTVVLDAGGALGGANVNSGTLSINGTLISAGGVNVAPDGTLGGNGLIVGNIANLGSIAPGTSIGTLSVAGNVNFAAGSSFDVEIEGSAVDLLSITGAAIVDPSATLNIVPLPGNVDVNNQAILTASSGVDANFQNIQTNGVIASVNRVDGTDLVLSTINPSPFAGAVDGAINDTFIMHDAVVAELDASLYGPDRRIWGRGIYDRVNRERDGIFSAFEQTTGGTMFGVDALFGENLRLGGALGYSASEVEFQDLIAEADIEIYHAGLYGNYRDGPLSISFGAQGGVHESDINRTVSTLGTLSTAGADTDGYLFGAHSKASWDVEIGGNWNGRLNLGVNYAHYSQDGFNDTLGYTFEKSSADTLRVGPSFDVIGTIAKSSITFKPRVSIGFFEEWQLGDRDIDIIVANGGLTTGSLDQGDEGYATLGVGTDMILGDRVTTYVNYDGAFSTNEDNNQISAGLRLGF